MSHPGVSYRADIDGLRAVAVSLVVLFHAFPSLLPGGFVGVDIFFVISGYLIGSILLREFAAGSFTYRAFYARRIRRIFPALLLVLTACYAFGWFELLADEFKQLGAQIAGGPDLYPTSCYGKEPDTSPRRRRNNRFCIYGR
ncbi:acyltransferase [Burkholderia multivorans]|uniref:acyltransferase family protein n=1 Tax=Burkholderia multivorans TaxID=87883 RepID=UPI001B99F348|nr:acyltransferase [Burkholderia multivorans]MBR8049225.1 acyltransferase [Burkholderia multivorans]